jgi:hypothetical protein
LQNLVFTDVSALQRIALAVTETQLAKMPALRALYGPAGVQHCVDDTVFHLRYLGEAVEFDDPVLFADYIAWAKVMLAARGVGANDLTTNLELIRGALLSGADRESVAPAVAILGRRISLSRSDE